MSPESEEEIKAYNHFASDHEHLMSKSLFCSGTTWPGVFTAEAGAASIISARATTSIRPGSAARASPAADCTPSIWPDSTTAFAARAASV